MSRLHGTIEVDWADNTYSFRLGLAEIEELERLANRSIFEIAMRADPLVRAATLQEYRECIRLGLVGGGMPPVDALRLTRDYMDRRPLDESRDVAHAVLLAGIARLDPKDLDEIDDATDPGEDRAAEEGASTSPPSTQAAS